jgi:hypothetical protein
VAIPISVGQRLDLSLQLEGGHTDKGVRAFIVDVTGASTVGGPYNLTHKVNGLYTHENPS